MLKTRQYIETLPNGVSHLILDETPTGMADNTREYIVPDGHFFAMGDNRDNSADSRFPDVGYVPYENLVGRAQYLFFSHNNLANILLPWEWPTAMRIERFFQPIE
jgi:signal peptidase I